MELFIPCLVEQVLPEIGLAMARILRCLGYELRYRREQTCCGQPAFNAGHRVEARAVARHCLEVFAGEDGGSTPIVCPSGSCVAMIRNFYPVLFETGAEAAAARSLGAQVFELGEFLAREGRLGELRGRAEGRVGFHCSCHAFRELRQSQRSALLSRVEGCELVELEGEPVCCGFGGLFSLKFDAIAAAMGRSRLERYAERGVETLLSNDPGCVMHLRQEAAAIGLPIRVRHVADFVAEALSADGAGSEP